jgi:beta-phosphoglucomutase-like phosphatase (HAD superfamily)
MAKGGGCRCSLQDAKEERPMSDSIADSVDRRCLLTGLGVTALGGAAATILGKPALAATEGNLRKRGEPVTVPSICVFDVNETLPEASPLKNAGIDGWFEKSLSIDRVRRFKPAPQVYHYAAEELNVPPAAICMVAAHVWDTIGAQSVGLSAALIARPGNAPLPVQGLPQPDAVGPDLPGVATQLISLWA